jgi:cytochrome b561
MHQGKPGCQSVWRIILDLSSVDCAPSTARYTPVAIALHWLLALTIAGLFGVGVYMSDLPFSPWRLKLYNWHKWAGITFLALSALRLLWRMTHRPPELPAAITQAMPAWQTRIYHATHHLLYLLFFAVPLLGWAYSSAAGFPIVWFGQITLPDLLSADKALAEVIKPLHKLAALALVGLAALHVAAALKHHWLDRDGLLLRMMPKRSI